MDQLKVTTEEKKMFIDYMLNNEELEKVIQKSCENPLIYELLVFGAIIERCQNDAGFIVAVNSDKIPAGADNIEFYTEVTKGCEMICAGKEDGTKYVMVFTSKERFQKAGDMSGMVMPIDDFIGVMCLKKEIDGMVINVMDEELIMETSALEILLKCIDMSKSASEQKF